MNRSIRYVFFFVLLAFPSYLLYSQGIQVSGIVLETEKSNPIENVNISIIGEPGGGTTDSLGEFSITVNKFPVLLYFSHLGYDINQLVIDEMSIRNVTIFLNRETIKIGEVAVNANPIKKIRFGDTLNVIDYLALESQILLVASPYKNWKDIRLYLTDSKGEPISMLLVKSAGKQIKIPENCMSETLFLFEDYFGNNHLLTKSAVRQIEVLNDSLSFTYSTSFSQFLKYLLPVRAKLGNSVFYQKSTEAINITTRTGSDAYRPQVVKTVYDERGTSKGQYDKGRYVDAAPRDRIKDIFKGVSAPIVVINDEILIFDFFKNHIEVFDSLGVSKRFIPITFHLETYRFFLSIFEATDLNSSEFKQKVLHDRYSDRIFALFHPLGKHPVLKEIDPQNGKVLREIDIPDFPNIEKLSVSNNKIFFTYQVKIYPFYNSLFQMKI
ncbi:MAG: carboxypeptidase-like regulatory domain-containing protein [Bacteroidota bacterium]|nr:carboxypeptidase-like regulatory domain-containing protein [Bacteroidota bacterium]